MNNNDTLCSLIEGINHISLNHEDLLDSVLEFAKSYKEEKTEDDILVDIFFKYGTFVDQSLMASREGIVLAMSAITLDEKVDFKEVINGCVNIAHQRAVEDEICHDNAVKEIMRRFLTGLRREVFSRLYSQNKDFERISKIPKSVLTQRYNLFMSEPF